jgi:hypothetical protein
VASLRAVSRVSQKNLLFHFVASHSSDCRAQGGWYNADVNWEAINAVAQIISSVAVVASFWYLALQVHRSTRIAKLAAQDAATTALREVTRPFTDNAEVARIWRIGLENLAALNPEEKARFFHAAFQFLKAMETIHFHYVYGLMEEQIWRGWRNLYRHYLATPGLDHYWQLRRDLFSERFQVFISQLDLPAKRLTVANLLGVDTPPKDD